MLWKLQDNLVFGKIYFKQIFAKHWETCQEQYNPRDIEIETVEKMLNCGNLEYGYALYLCNKCGNWRKVPFICKTRLCPTCGIVRIENWSERIKSRLFSGVEHRHIVLTTPRELWEYFQRDMNLLKVLSGAGVELMYDIICFYKQKEGITPGIICVIAPIISNLLLFDWHRIFNQQALSYWVISINYARNVRSNCR